MDSREDASFTARPETEEFLAPFEEAGDDSDDSIEAAVRRRFSERAQDDGLPGFEQAFERELAVISLWRARVLHWAVLTIYALFWLLDLAVADPHATTFLMIRLTVCACCAVGLLLLYSPWASRFAEAAVFVNAVAATTGISIMSSYLGGFESNYFVGNMIAIATIGYFMPWTVRNTVALTAVVVAVYAVTNWEATPPDGRVLTLVTPLAFLLGTGLFTAIANLTERRTLRRDLQLRLQLEHANEELKELDEAKTRFFANVSHELRSPLTLLVGPIQTLRSQLHGSDESRLLDSMKTNANRLLRQVDALLDIAKIESGSLRLDVAEENLGELLEEVVSSARPHAERKGIGLRTEKLDRLPDSVFDPDKVWVIAGNLISNALKFTAEGGVTVRARTEDESVIFEVEDTGPGIPLEEQDKIFDRFYQVDATSSRRHQGTGVGLALARELARLHGGDLTVRSTPGSGATFIVELPRMPKLAHERRRGPRRREDRLAQARTLALTAREYERARGETVLADIDVPRLAPKPSKEKASEELSATVLLVDDNEDLVHYLTLELSQRYRLLTASDGVEALEILHSRPVDLVVSDLMMPGMDGRQLCAEIRSEKALARIPVILVTARASSEAVIEGLKLGADDYVTKPFVVRELEARIDAQIRRLNAERRLAERESRLAAIGQMTSAVAHDLRNALTIVKGYAELADMIAQDESSAALTEPLQQIRSAVDRLGRMTEEILQFARGGSPNVDRRPVDVGVFLRDTLQPMVGDLERRGIELRIDTDGTEGLSADLDCDAMTRVFENLVANSRDALAQRREGNRLILVQARADDGGLWLEVGDNGPGIPEEMVPHVFEPFHSGKRSTGLGLATVRNIVKAHGGEITAFGQGTSGGAQFSIRLPAKVATAAVT